MSVVNDIIKDIPIPNMVKVRQEFDRTRLEDVAAEVRKCLDRREILVNLRPGMTVAVAVGSRGISNHALIVRETVRFCGSTEPGPLSYPPWAATEEPRRRDSGRSWKVTASGRNTAAVRSKQARTAP